MTQEQIKSTLMTEASKLEKQAAKIRELAQGVKD